MELLLKQSNTPWYHDLSGFLGFFLFERVIIYVVWVVTLIYGCNISHLQRFCTWMASAVRLFIPGWNETRHFFFKFLKNRFILPLDARVSYAQSPEYRHDLEHVNMAYNADVERVYITGSVYPCYFPKLAYPHPVVNIPLCCCHKRTHCMLRNRCIIDP